MFANNVDFASQVIASSSRKDLKDADIFGTLPVEAVASLLPKMYGGSDLLAAVLKWAKANEAQLTGQEEEAVAQPEGVGTGAGAGSGGGGGGALTAAANERGPIADGQDAVEEQQPGPVTSYEAPSFDQLLLQVLPHLPFGSVPVAEVIRQLAVPGHMPLFVSELLACKHTGQPRGQVTATNLTKNTASPPQVSTAGGSGINTGGSPGFAIGRGW